MPTTVTVSRDAAGRCFVSKLCDDPTVKPLAAMDAAVGIDVGLNHLLALSTGEKIANPRHERRDRARLATAQRHCARKEKGSGRTGEGTPQRRQDPRPGSRTGAGTCTS